MRGSPYLVLVAFLLACTSCTTPPELPRESPPAGAVAPRAEAPVAPPCAEIVRIEVWKGDRTLRAYCKQGAVLAMHVALGRDARGHKLRSGDHRTPEGKYRVGGTARASRHHLFLPIDYPSPEDAEAALVEGRLARSDYERILLAHAEGVPPPNDTTIGGNLGFHGEGRRWQGDSRYLDWTYGCIAVTDDQIEFIASRVEPGTPVLIHP